MASVQVCLVSDQLLPNVISVFVEKPQKVVLLVTQQMDSKAQALACLLNPRGITTEIHLISAYGFSDVLETCRGIIEKHPDDSLTLNVTGGTKVAALAAFQQFYFSDLRIIYIDTSHDRILELGDKSRTIPLKKNYLKVKDYLACYDKQFAPGTDGGPPAGYYERIATTKKIAELLIHNPELMSAVNQSISRYKTERRKPYLGLFPTELPKGSSRLCSLLQEAQVVTPGVEGSVNVNSDESLFYLGGGWLEEYVYSTIGDLHIAGLDLMMNVQIDWQSEGKSTTRNELDIVFTHRNRLHFISCKTSGIDQKGPESRRGKEALYELDSLAERVGGLFGQSMLVSAHRLGSASRQRAKDLGIEIVDGNDLLGLGKRLQEVWLADISANLRPKST